MSMAWMRMPGQTWAGSAASFVGMWTVMMVAMMLPSFTPTLSRYREAVEVIGIRRKRLTFVFALGYFLLWSAVGVAVFLTGTLLAVFEMQSPGLARSVPLATGIIVLVAGALQFTAWKAHHLGCCRETPKPALDAVETLRNGMRLGRHCCCGCAGLTAILLVIGVMDLRAMAAITGAITIERLAPSGERVARVIGGIVVAVGLYMIARAA
jgi:predicted metal-binding membrane protein